MVQPEKYPQLTSLKSCFIRGSVVRYIQIPPELVDVELLQDAARKENAPNKNKNWTTQIERNERVDNMLHEEIRQMPMQMAGILLEHSWTCPTSSNAARSAFSIIINRPLAQNFGKTRHDLGEKRLDYSIW